MEQRDLWKSLTGTACVLGFAISSMNFNSTQVIGSVRDSMMANYRMSDEQVYNASMLYADTNHIYTERRENRLESEAKLLFGKMREATAEESASVNNYVRNISKDTGVNFFDLC